MKWEEEKKQKQTADRKRREDTWNQILYDYEKFKDQKGVRDLWFDGIPETIWGKVWMRVTGNSNQLTK